jgi:alpha-tubulin suppressor-like RCC1 family protein
MGSGGIKCWGANSNGALGDGTLVSHLTPVDVTGLPGGAVKVVTSITSTCALTTSSGIKCWGNNSFGQLGDGLGGDTGYGSELYSATPVDVVGLTSGQSDLAMSYVYGCGSSASGGVQCWGINDAGQAGTGFANLVFLYPKPTAVLGLGNNIAAVSVGEDHACALVTGGVVRCWGSNGYGELGSTGRAYQITAGAVQNLPGSVSQVAAGENYSCLLSNAGGVACWGDNEYGQLGNGSLRQSLTPVTVSGLTSGIKAISTSRQSMTPFSCALTVGGGVKCWGDNSYGQLGDGTTNPHLSPVDVNGLASGVIQVSVGMNHACALTAAGGVKCWGDNSSFQLGDGTQAPRFTPVDASGLANGVHQISAGSGYSCALLNSGGVKCWGIPGPHTPGDIPGVSNLSSGITAIAVESSGSLNCAITVGGGVQCWNYDSLSSNWSSYSIGLDSGVTQIDTGNGDVCATTSSGTAFCYGTNLNGQLGNGSYINGGPYPISGLGSDIAMVATGGSHTCALTKGGTISCWGDNSYGQLGYGSATNYAASPRPAVSFGPTLYLPLIVR